MYGIRFDTMRRQIRTLLAAAMALLTLGLAAAQSNVQTWGSGGSGVLGDGTNVSRGFAAPTFALTEVSQVSAGEYHSLAVRANGEVWGWGYNASGQLGDGTNATRYAPVKVEGLTGVTQVAGGGYHSLALKSDGTVWVWGSNSWGQLGIGAADNNPHLTPTQVAGLNGILAIAAGRFHNLALKNNGTVWVWGWNGDGQLGDGTTTQRNAPVQIMGLNPVTNIAAGSEHSLARGTDGTVWAWGSNEYGQLGVPFFAGTNTPTSSPVNVVGVDNVTEVAAGAYHSLARASDGVVKSWGRNNYGQLGNGVVSNTGPDHTPATVNNLPSASVIEAGGYFSMARVTGGEVKTWGANYVGQLGVNSLDNGAHNTPETVNLSGVAHMTAGGNHVLAVKWDGTLFAWGSNTGGELGDGTNTMRLLPTLVQGMTRIVAASGLSAHTLALDVNGRVWAWGNNTYGRLGDGSTVSRTTPVRVLGLENMVAIAGGGTHSLAVSQGGQVWAWGKNFGGELGLDTNFADELPMPLVIAGLTGVRTVAAGARFSLALKQDGTVWAWGRNNYGQLGQGATDANDHPTPTQVPGLSGVVAIACGEDFALALRSDGMMRAWGRNNFGQIGDGTTTNRAAPTPVLALTGIRAIAAGIEHGLALTAAGMVWGWGYNASGQLGLGAADFNAHSVPTQIPGLEDVRSLAAGQKHSLALLHNGTVRAWGDNATGQLGMGFITNQVYPAPMEAEEMAGLGGVAAVWNTSLALIGVEVAGQLTREDMADNAPVMLIEAEFRPTNGFPGAPYRRVAEIQPDGTFSILGVLPNHYTLWIKGHKWLAKTTGVDARNGDVTTVSEFLRAGDANNDNSVDVLDLDLLIQAFDSTDGTGNWIESADFNCDDSVDVLDLDLLLRNFDQGGDW